VKSADPLIALLDAHHITDRALVAARERARTAGDAASAAALRRETIRYFSAVARESGSTLAALDRKLEELYQRQYNLQAERGVVERRLSGARKALCMAAEPGVGERR
jgi:hypothetical protein